jgi:hypothetical protein
MEALPSLDEKKGCLTLAFPADRSFQLQQLETDLAVVHEKVLAVWGRKLRVAAVLAETEQDQAAVASLRREVTPSDRDILDDACREDRPLSELVDLLGGEPLPADERRRWPTAGDDESSDPDSSSR